MISPTPQMASYLPPLPESFGNPMLRGMHEILPPEAISWLPTAPGVVCIGSHFGDITAPIAVDNGTSMASQWLSQRGTEALINAS